MVLVSAGGAVMIYECVFKGGSGQMADDSKSAGHKQLLSLLLLKMRSFTSGGNQL